MRRHHRDEPHGAEIDEVEARIALVDVMEDQVGLAVEQPLPGSGDGLEMQMQPRAGTIVEEAAQQAEHLRQRAEIADDDAELAFLARCQLLGMMAQRAELAEKDARALVEGAPGVGQGDAIAAAVQQGEAGCASRFFTAAKTVGWVRCNFAAAAWKLPSLTTASKQRS